MSDDEKERAKSRFPIGFAALLAGFALVGVLAAVLLPRAREAERRVNCEDNLKQAWLSIKEYANSHMGMFPPISRVPGRFFPAREGYFPDYLDEPHVLVCPSDSTLPSDDEFAQSELGPIWDDYSYIYFGYTISDEEEGLAFLEAYEQKVTEAIGAGNIAYDEAREEWLLPEDFWLDSLYVGEGRGTGPLAYLMRLAENMGRFLITDVAPLRANPVSVSHIMIFWDRPGTEIADFSHKPRGTNILFANGHVEFETYPSDKYILSPGFVDTFLQTEARVEELYANFVEAQDR